jgi:hypothetical protein
MKTILIAAATATMLLGSASLASAQTYPQFARNDHTPHYDAWGNDLNGPPYRTRCDGMSYGTGARSCGTATGGPVGGLSSRN